MIDSVSESRRCVSGWKGVMPVVFCVPKAFSYAGITCKVHVNTQCGIFGIYNCIPTLLVTLSPFLQVCCIMPVAEYFKIKLLRRSHIKYIFQSFWAGGLMSWLTSCITVLLQKVDLIFYQLVKKFLAFSGIWRFVTVSTTTLRLYLSGARRI
jgi:hypothetical protein